MRMDFLKGILFAALSSATFGLAPFFSISLLDAGYSSFEVLFYRWGVASLSLIVFGLCTGCDFRLPWRDLKVVFLLCLFRAATSVSLIIAYQNIASGVASTIHFMYPLAVTLAMMFIFKERKSVVVLLAVVMSLVGALFLTSGDIHHTGGRTVVGIAAACVSVFSYGGYIIGVRKTRAVNINSTVLTSYVMGIGAVLFFVVGCFTSGIRVETDGMMWLYILGLALPATAISNITLVKAVKYVGPTLTSILGALEPLTAVVIGVSFLGEQFTVSSAIGILLVTCAVTVVVLMENRMNRSVRTQAES